MIIIIIVFSTPHLILIKQPVLSAIWFNNTRVVSILFFTWKQQEEVSRDKCSDLYTSLNTAGVSCLHHCTLTDTVSHDFTLTRNHINSGHKQHDLNTVHMIPVNICIQTIQVVLQWCCRMIYCSERTLLQSSIINLTLSISLQTSKLWMYNLLILII